MAERYLITGASGHLGSTILRSLVEQGKRVSALCLPGDPFSLPGAEVFYGDVTEPASMRPFFESGNDGELILIHCAGLVTVATKFDPRVVSVNIEGTRHVMELAARFRAARIIYVSTVHAIPETTDGPIRETKDFSPRTVPGQYAKTKAIASRYVLHCAEKGSPVSIVHPSGIIGPGDTQLNNHMTLTVKGMADGSIPTGIPGGYDFVDVRDVSDGILSCIRNGRFGECYILSGVYCPIMDLLREVRKILHKKAPRFCAPTWAAAVIAPAAEQIRKLQGRQSILTPYSIRTLRADVRFSHEKASAELGYSPRSLTGTLRDLLPELVPELMPE